jgi:hypothetical protein
MKTLKSATLIILLLLFNTGVVNAIKPENNKVTTECEKSLYKDLRSQIIYPSFAQEQKIEGFVVVSFTYNNKGDITIVEANSNNDQLKAYVIEKLSKTSVASCVRDSDQVFSMRFDFRLQ